MHITDWSSDLSSSDLAHADLIARLTALYADDPLLHPLWDSAVKTQELASDIGGNNGRNGADLGKLAASLMLPRSEEHTSDLQSLMRISYAVFGLQKKHCRLAGRDQTDQTRNTIRDRI